MSDHNLTGYTLFNNEISKMPAQQIVQKIQTS
jgi:hypothetical protein